MISGSRVLVTGACGFLGANLVRTLLHAGAEVIAVARPSSNCWRLREVEPHIRLLRTDLQQLATTAEPGRVDIVYHLASAGVDQRVHDVTAMIEANIVGTHAVLVLAERLGVKRFVQLGSSGEYGPGLCLEEDHPLSPTAEYGATKAAGTILAQAFGRRTGLPVVVLRPFSVFGPWEAAYRLIPYCILRGMNGQPVQITGGQQTRDYVFVDDVMRACIAAATAPEAIGQTINVSTGISTAVREVVERILKLCGSPNTAAFGTRPHASSEMWTTSGDPDRARRLLGWEATTSLDDGLRATVDWFKRERQRYPGAYSG